MQSPPLPRPSPHSGWLAGLACCVCCALLNLEMKCSFCCCHRCSSNLHKSTAISRIRNEKCISRGSIDSTRLHRCADKRGREVGCVGVVVTLLHTLSILTRQCLKNQLVRAIKKYKFCSVLVSFYSIWKERVFTLQHIVCDVCLPFSTDCQLNVAYT